MHSFCWYELRTTDPTAARTFYIDALGLLAAAGDARWRLASGGPELGEFAPLPAQAAARGAPAHWLGHIAVADVAIAVQRFVAAGASPLGPTQTRPDGNLVAPLRDPLGAVLAVTSRPPATATLAWCDLHTGDPARAAAIYGELFNWAPKQQHDLGPARGSYHEFAWQPDGHSVGGMSDAALRPGIHTHWLFHFAVDDLELALGRVRGGGGRVAGEPLRGPGGARVAVCEDPQGAAFALHAAT
ncbi:VOC family protein [Nannocystis bainbridge]|uniref:VOC family protein n=1 Tax=Nannocystis bainbridge TaxID=2995303 RepID=A0ABT5DRT9_9BACT|nr:VOC family protein [Nannocystis bainbridge]MDC0716366.1 VOC family protein [Nannocystis bainbridge]